MTFKVDANTYSGSMIFNVSVSTFPFSFMSTQKEKNGDNLRDILCAYRHLKKKALELAIKEIDSYRKSKSVEDYFLVSRNTKWMLNIRGVVCRVDEYRNPQGAFWLCY